eukprot:CAMPEP_0194282776 /NCGR_PEP_ID=MMETSP0169-20130528/23854_1 /TAXON_ID=218684 /ORGANISM="Corethron pennatum, Strain L29A3" /LENGTH=393 /DNA_ID=CAMNT_0039028199 /DNA_START=177 /DNA_END=1358 /DNA_ORIENTATION=+
MSRSNFDTYYRAGSPVGSVDNSFESYDDSPTVYDDSPTVVSTVYGDSQTIATYSSQKSDVNNSRSFLNYFVRSSSRAEHQEPDDNDTYAMESVTESVETFWNKVSKNRGEHQEHEDNDTYAMESVAESVEDFWSKVSKSMQCSSHHLSSSFDNLSVTGNKSPLSQRFNSTAYNERSDECTLNEDETVIHHDRRDENESYYYDHEIRDDATYISRDDETFNRFDERSYRDDGIFATDLDNETVLHIEDEETVIDDDETCQTFLRDDGTLLEDGASVFVENENTLLGHFKREWFLQRRSVSNMAQIFPSSAAVASRAVWRDSDTVVSEANTCPPVLQNQSYRDCHKYRNLGEGRTENDDRSIRMRTIDDVGGSGHHRRKKEWTIQEVRESGIYEI